MINTHAGNSSCCNLCSALCRGHLYIVKHVSGTAPSPLSRLWAFSHSDSTAVKTLLTTTVSNKIALGTNNFIWMFCPSDILQTKTPQLLSPSVSSSTQRFIPVTDSQTQQGQTLNPLRSRQPRTGA